MPYKKIEVDEETMDYIKRHDEFYKAWEIERDRFMEKFARQSRDRAKGDPHGTCTKWLDDHMHAVIQLMRHLTHYR